MLEPALLRAVSTQLDGETLDSSAAFFIPNTLMLVNNPGRTLNPVPDVMLVYSQTFFCLRLSSFDLTIVCNKKSSTVKLLFIR